MILNLFNIIYVMVAIAMIALILLQRGAGAQAGSGFGGGASGTVFGARGATTFLSRSTALLAALFFVLSIAMAWYLGHTGVAKQADDLGVLDTPAAKTTTSIPAPAKGDVPAAAPAEAAPAPGNDVPAAPVAEKKADAAPATPEKH